MKIKYVYTWKLKLHSIIFITIRKFDVDCIRVLKTIFYNSSIQHKECYLKYIMQHYSGVVPVYRTSKAQYRSIKRIIKCDQFYYVFEIVLPL